MRALDILRLRLRTLLTRRRLDREVEEELQYHLDRQMQQNLAAGMPPDRARQAAIHALGGAARIQEECREARGFLSFAALGSDLARGWSVFGREPVFGVAVVATLASASASTRRSSASPMRSCCGASPCVSRSAFFRFCSPMARGCSNTANFSA